MAAQRLRTYLAFLTISTLLPRTNGAPVAVSSGSMTSATRAICECSVSSDSERLTSRPISGTGRLARSKTRSTSLRPQDQNNQGCLLLGTNSANAGSVNFFNPSEFVGTPNSNGSNLKPVSVPSPTGTIPVSALSASSLKLTSGVRNLYGVGLRPVFWVLDNFAIQGQAGYNYVDNFRGYSGTNAFGRGGSIGVFTIAPTIKPKGGYFTRPEIRVFATYSIWSNSLRGSTTPIGEGGKLG